MTTPEQLDLAESEIAFLITKAHNSGLNYWQILDIFLRATCDLHIKASTEYQIRQGGQ